MKVQSASITSTTVQTPLSRTNQLYGSARYADKDLKPALALWYVKDLLGEKRFAEATRYYIQAWAGKHPTPYNFFNCMNSGANMDLNWFWHKWYFDKAIPDLAISKVSRKNDAYNITVSNLAGAPVPVHLTLHDANGEKVRISKNITVWRNTNKCNIAIKGKSEIIKIMLGDPYDADIHQENNSWISTQLGN